MIRRTNEVITRVPMGNGGRLGVLDADQRMQCCKRTKKKTRHDCLDYER